MSNIIEKYFKDVSKHKLLTKAEELIGMGDMDRVKDKSIY